MHDNFISQLEPLASPPSAAAASHRASTSVPSSTYARVHSVLLLLVCFVLSVWGLMQTLPLLPEADEGTWIGAASQIAATGNLDPGFYGHPGATTLYPLAAAWRLWLFLFPNQAWADTVWQMHFAGRLLSVAYLVLAVVVTAKIGQRVWNLRVGIVAGWILALSPLTVFYAKLLRTDTAATFWGALAILLSLRLLDSPGLRRQLAAGAAIGLSIASRYFLAATALVLVAVDGILLAGAGKDGRTGRLWWSMLLGLLAVPAAFLLANPAMPFHWRQVLLDLTSEARVEHLGADGLGLWGNLWFYLFDALPSAFTWPLTLLVFVGALLTLLRGSLQARVLLAWVAAFLLLISIPSLHWDRWLIPALPVLALLAAAALHWGVDSLFALPRMRRSSVAHRADTVFVFFAVLLLVAPLSQSVRHDISLMGVNTRLEARRWLEENAATGSLVLQETYGAPLEGIALESQEVGDFYKFDAIVEQDPDAQARLRLAEYLVASSYIYGRYYAEPERYADAVAWYDRLFAEGDLLVEFAPNWQRNGPVVRIYRANSLAE
jgi:4-amino-4-deoxy-L-arabinose transferase-like glycosyltransferase